MTGTRATPLRPRPARWFELLVARDDTTLALEALAATGAVELEARSGAALPEAFADLHPLLQQFGELAQRYRAFWPPAAARASAFPEPPARALARCIARIRAWAVTAEPLIRALQQGEGERAELAAWHAALMQLADSALDLSQAAGADDTPRAVQLRLVVLPAGADPAAATLPQGVILRRFAAPTSAAPGTRAAAQAAGPGSARGGELLLALGTPPQLHALAQQALALKGQVLAPPPWLGADTAASAAEAARRHAALDAHAGALRRALDEAAQEHGLSVSLADAQRLQWVIDNVHGLESGGLFCWITGWTSTEPAALEQAVEASGARALLRLAPPPPEATAPMLLANPRWARPFEVFARALGTPSGTEADPSVLLALTVPLMFGYMFGDVGQGLMIAAGGLLLRRRLAIARLFVAGGLAAAAFGLLFGSVFSLHLLHPLWLAPLDDPLAVLALPLAGGAVLLTLGLLLGALQAHWRGALARWLHEDLGFMLCYLGALAALATGGAPPALAAALAGALLFCAGHAWHAGRVLAFAAALGELLERMLQILINTLSFARVGAFALAHAGLSAAIVALIAAADSAWARAAVLVLGNLLVIALEGLVVSIQTTRLVLFEFFARFLEGRGRVFRPLPLPPSAPQAAGTIPSNRMLQEG